MIKNRHFFFLAHFDWTKYFWLNYLLINRRGRDYCDTFLDGIFLVKFYLHFFSFIYIFCKLKKNVKFYNILRVIIKRILLQKKDSFILFFFPLFFFFSFFCIFIIFFLYFYYFFCIFIIFLFFVVLFFIFRSFFCDINLPENSIFLGRQKTASFRNPNYN